MRFLEIKKRILKEILYYINLRFLLPVRRQLFGHLPWLQIEDLFPLLLCWSGLPPKVTEKIDLLGWQQMHFSEEYKPIKWTKQL